MSKSSRRTSRAGRSGPAESSDRPGPVDPASRPGPAGTGGRHAASGPSGTPRAGRRERTRPSFRQQSFFARNRSRLVAAGFSVIVVLAVAFLFIGATEKVYSCASLMTPAPAASVAPGGSPQLGQAQADMGRTHIAIGQTQRYVSCPPASGNHYIATSGAPNAGPIPARFYSPDDPTVPEGWIHNLEHGALVVLYSCANGCPDAATLQKLKDFAGPGFPTSPVCRIPPGNIGPVVTRFDDMSTKFAGLVWDRVLLQDSLDTDQLLAFFKAEGERFNPEAQCAAPSASPSAVPSAAPASPSTVPSVAPASPSASPAGPS